ncbi:AIPR family protein [Bacillus thuringiensis]|uniref:AIPR family protein n=1 Tax=Bacillus thuringiensis TaxID=1428 RepID=A0A0B5NGS8_BACTU|nr:AIPR family protein [Bacillus thuringiensis]AJG75560.1 AIPR family protein [Bacillus thuringiensis]MCU4922162.1 AIPR family protein [Bacillus cereus]OTX52929.1 hypothetical protein BK723_15165 [Bacillus thuringiensis serovar pondicheriensis]QKH25833.1 AIPR family protein [Bacillus thuringiensis]
MSLVAIIKSRVISKLDQLEEFKAHPQEVQEGIAFSLYSVENIFKNFNSSEIEEGIVDSSYRGEKADYGIDAIYATANKEYLGDVEQLEEYNQDSKFEFHILQFKKGKGIDVETLLKLKEGIEKTFINNELVETENEYMYGRMNDIRELSNEIYERFSPKQIKIKVYICFSGSRILVDENEDIQIRIKDIKKLLMEDGYSNVEFVVVGSQELIDLERGREEIKDTISYEKSFKYITTAEEEQKLNGHIAIVKGEEIARLVKEWQNALFEANIRDYYTSNVNNEKILDTCSDINESKYFWSFNNGLTITCREVEDLPNNKLKIHGLQIVNGCQTSNTIYKAYSNNLRCEELENKGELTKEEQAEYNTIKNKKLDKQTAVLIKIIETKDEDLVYRITETTNSQTAITAFSIKANEDIHKNIEVFMEDHGMYYERRINFYRNKGISAKEIVDIKKLAQVYMAMVKFKPSQAMANPKKMFTTHYNTIFPDLQKHSVNYELYLVPVLIQLKLEEKIRSVQRLKQEEDVYNKKLMSYGKFHLGCFVMSSILDNDYNEKGIIRNVERIKKALEDDKVFEGHFYNAIKKLRSVVEISGGADIENVVATLKNKDIDSAIAQTINIHLSRKAVVKK